MTTKDAAEDWPAGRVVYIEDSPMSALLMKEWATQFPKLDLIVAATGQEGLECCVHMRPDVVLLDLQLPDLSGWEVLSLLRDNPALCRTPVVVVSANAAPEDIQCAIEQGAAAYWLKPISFAQVRSDLAALLSAARPRPTRSHQ